MRPKTYVLVPEISNHTPAYLWGDAVRRLFHALETGYSMAATMHADSPEEVLAALEGPPLYIPLGLLANLHAVINLRLVYSERGMLRRVDRVTMIEGAQASPHGRGLRPVAHWAAEDDTFVHDGSPEALASIGTRFRMAGADVQADLGRRADTLASWLKSGRTGPGDVQRMAARYYESPPL